LEVAYQGEPGAYGEEAVIGHFGADGVEPLPLPTFSAVCSAVASGSAAAALLPIENSIAGSVGEAVDALIRSHLSVVGEVLLPVRHQLLALPGVAGSEVRSVASHRQALAQCEAYLARGGWTVVVAEDTAGAARELSESGDRSRAVIASVRAAERYGLEILERDIQDHGGNMTRFVVAIPDGAETPSARGALAPSADAPYTTLVVFETRHVPGALHYALGAFAEAGVNMSRIESRPTGRAHWQYRFLVALAGDAEEEPLASALEALRERTHDLRVLGSFNSAG
jgi:prephenate dehydratase